ncbi:MAG TPA: cytochrome c-type biogenesis protein CcmH [Actinomycetota bacterium]|nr:cytochrome c-type biogenesis protein CcmH [Actinomycetota bacterium]
MQRIAFVLLAVAALLSSCRHDTQTVAERAQAIEAQVWSPYCPGRLLIDCTTSQARELRTDIVRRLQRGDSTARVLDWIRLNHGQEALARPSSGAVWAVPIALLFIGAIVVAWLIRRWSRSPARSANPTA